MGTAFSCPFQQCIAVCQVKDNCNLCWDLPLFHGQTTSTPDPEKDRATAGVPESLVVAPGHLRGAQQLHREPVPIIENFDKTQNFKTGLAATSSEIGTSSTVLQADYPYKPLASSSDEAATTGPHLKCLVVTADGMKMPKNEPPEDLAKRLMSNVARFCETTEPLAVNVKHESLGPDGSIEGVLKEICAHPYEVVIFNVHDLEAQKKVLGERASQAKFYFVSTVTATAFILGESESDHLDPWEWIFGNLFSCHGWSFAARLSKVQPLESASRVLRHWSDLRDAMVETTSTDGHAEDLGATAGGLGSLNAAPGRLRGGKPQANYSSIKESSDKAPLSEPASDSKVVKFDDSQD